MTITVFKAGPFRIGYVDFPVGGTLGSGTLNAKMIASLKETCFPIKLHCLRIPVSAFSESIELPNACQLIPETAILNLQEWHPERNSKLRRVIKRFEKSSLRIVDATEPSQGKVLFHLYRDTLSRRGGNMRYTDKYFCALVGYAAENSNIRCLLALVDDEIAGFLIVACHMSIAYYLHGSISHRFRGLYPSDLLFLEAIGWAKKRGMNCFNMMPSPSDQPSLIRYKEKWGGTTMTQKVYDLPLKPVQAMICKSSAKLYDGLSRFMK
jgi:hypothetical protein